MSKQRKLDQTESKNDSTLPSVDVEGIANSSKSANVDVDNPNPKVDVAPYNNGAVSEIEGQSNKTKTTQAVETVIGSSSSANAAGGLMRAIAFGGGAGTDIGADVSATSGATEAYKSGARQGRRNDPITRKLNFNYPQIWKIKKRESKPLAETSEKQGYNGNYLNEHSVTSRVNGGMPADPDFSRDVSLISCDMGYYTAGQQVRRAGNPYRPYSAANYNLDPSTSQQAPYSGTAQDVMGDKGNYQPSKMTIKINTSNNNVSLEFEEVDLSLNSVDEATSRLSSDHALRDMNINELDRLSMVNKAGNESDPSWSALGDATRTATAVNNVLRDLDTLAGDYVMFSERKLANALSYQINKAGNDGVRIIGPMAEMANGNIEGAQSTALASCSEANGRAYLFNVNAYLAGGAGLYIAMSDSIRKYNTKADLLTQRLSFANALSVARANHDFLRCHNEFIKDVQHAELFSTIDTPYAINVPIVCTDKGRLISPISFTNTGNTATSDVDATGTVAGRTPIIFNYHYENLRNKWTIPVYNFFVEGIRLWLADNVNSILNATGADGTRVSSTAVDNVVTIDVPIVSSTTSVSLWDLMVCSAVPYMIRERQKVMCDVIKYEQNFGYPYSGTSALKDVDVHAALNYQFIDTDTALQSRVANPIDAIKVQLPEVFWPVSVSEHSVDVPGITGNYDCKVAHTVLPHYFNQNQFVEDDQGAGFLIYSDNPSQMSYPSTRGGENLKFMDVIYGMSEEDYRLALDRMVTYPGYVDLPTSLDTTGDISKVVADNNLNAFPSYTYKYGFTSDGIPTIPYMAAVSKEARYGNCLTIKDVMKTPRELGLHFVMPAGVLTPVSDPDTQLANFRNPESGYLAVSGPGFYLTFYRQAGSMIKNSSLSDPSYTKGINAAYINTYNVISCTADDSGTDIGVIFSLSRAVTAMNADGTMTVSSALHNIPFAANSYTQESQDYTFGDATYGITETKATNATKQTLEVFSMQKYIYARLQMLPFIVNPFDCAIDNILNFTGNVEYGAKADIYDFLIYFGMCGFRASDFSELTYERNKMRIAQGMNYVSDPYVDKSLLLK